MGGSPNTEEFLQWVTDTEDWYDYESTKWTRVLSLCRLVALFASLLALVFAAASDADFLKGYAKWLLVGTTFLSAFSTEVLSKLNVRELEDLREDGHIEASRIAKYTKQKLVQFADAPDKIFALQDEVRGMLYELDKQQHRRDVQIKGPSNSATGKLSGPTTDSGSSNKLSRFALAAIAYRASVWRRNQIANLAITISEFAN